MTAPNEKRDLLDELIRDHLAEGKQPRGEIYQAASEETGLEALESFCSKWDSRYSLIGKSWRNNWAKIIPMFLYPEELRRTIYTTNAIESMNMTLRKASKNHRIFPDGVSRPTLFSTPDIEPTWLTNSSQHAPEWIKPRDIVFHVLHSYQPLI